MPRCRAAPGRAVDLYLVVRNWLFGWYVVEFEQGGSDRAAYGEGLIRELSGRLSARGMKGVSTTNIKQFRSFYLSRREIGQAATDLSSEGEAKGQALTDLLSPAAVTGPDSVHGVVEVLVRRFRLSWTHCVVLLTIDDAGERHFYEVEAAANQWSVRELERQNRLDGDDKEYGYAIDYKDSFKSLEKSIKDYTGEAFEGYDAEDVAGLLEDRLEKGRQRLEELREAVKAVCEPVEPPRDTAAYVRFFCAAQSGNADELKDNEPKRVALYKLVASLVRAYANLANEMAEAGYSNTEAAEVKAEVAHYEKVREEVKLASGDYIDMKLYEPAMRHLLDAYIRAEESEQVSAFDDMTLVELIVESGEDAVESLPEGLRSNAEAMAETIENNVRRLIIDEMAVNPKYYEKMSELLDALILERKQERAEIPGLPDEDRRVDQEGEQAREPVIVSGEHQQPGASGAVRQSRQG